MLTPSGAETAALLGSGPHAVSSAGDAYDWATAAPGCAADLNLPRSVDAGDTGCGELVLDCVPQPRRYPVTRRTMASLVSLLFAGAPWPVEAPASDIFT